MVTGIIKLLPDSVANQIAAGEVVQRPASAVKELLENSLDAGATEIKLVIKDGGTSLIQVIDNGIGMSELDARMAWERHATSKIESAQDIYALRTFGFRGEALASIAAVAQVELKTRRNEDEMATVIRVEGSRIVEQTFDTGPTGTSISIKNLFFNIPARRNFLKSVSVESKHIVEEFQRQALARPDVSFKFFNNGSETYNLTVSDIPARITSVLGIKKELLEVHEQTEIIGISGYIGVPELCRKTRGDQFFYVNGRYIRSPYFTHAVQAAYAGVTEEGSYPLFVLHLHIDPSKVDVNVHPTKTEVKFEDERHIYNILKASVRKSLGNFVVQPEAELFGLGGVDAFLKSGMQRQENWDNTGLNKSELYPGYNPFGNKYQGQQRQEWTKILGPVDEMAEIGDYKRKNTLIPETPEIQVQQVMLLRNKYAAALVNDEMYLVHLPAAMEKVYFHQFFQRSNSQKSETQQLLFPRTLDLNPSRLHLIRELMEDFQALGFEISHFGGHSVIINGLPPEVSKMDETSLIESMLEEYENSQGGLKTGNQDKLALSLARQAVRQNLNNIDDQSVQNLIYSMFALPDQVLPFRNKPVAVKIGIELIQEIFRKV